MKVVEKYCWTITGYEVVTLQLIMFCVFKFEFEVDFLVMHTKI